jgi:hypothetical protein
MTIEQKLFGSEVCMARWEYFTIDRSGVAGVTAASVHEMLTFYEAQGWEFAGVVAPAIFIFRRLLATTDNLLVKGEPS